MDQPVQKRGPGRPPRRHVASIPSRGILDAPDNEDNIVEFSYHDSSPFRYIFTTFKNLKVHDAYFRFAPESFTIFAKDHLGNSIRVSINCDSSSSYYCKKELFLCINESNLGKIFLNVHKSVNKMTMSYGEDDDCMSIVLDGLDLGKEKNYMVPVTQIEPPYSYSDMDTIVEDSLIRLSFNLSAKDFKETISNAANYGNKITIEKHGDSDLEFKFEKTFSDGCVEKFRDGEKIGLECDIEDDESFRCCLHTLTIKAITNSANNSNSNIFIKCLNDNKALFMVKIIDILDMLVFAETNQ